MHRKSARRHRWATRMTGTPFPGQRHTGRKNAGPPGSRHRRPCKSSEQEYSPLNGVDPVQPANPQCGCGQATAGTGMCTPVSVADRPHRRRASAGSCDAFDGAITTGAPRM
jgi:hypothetical protein